MRTLSLLLAAVLVMSAAVAGATEQDSVTDFCTTYDSATDTAEGCEVDGTTLPLGASAFEPTMGAAPDGSIYMATTPTTGVAVGFGVGVHKSSDDGKSWTDVQPRIAGRTVPPETNDPYGYVDPNTGRIFSFHMAPILLCSVLSFSDDGGQTWTTPPVGCGPSGAWDHQTMAAAPPTDGVTTVGYPNVLVQCVNAVYAEMCARSLDGGLTWGTSIPAYVNQNLSRLCGTQTGHLFSDSDGNFYLPTPVCGDRASMFVSTDSGLTWNERVINDETMPFTDPALDFDADGNLHAVWVDLGNRLRYAMSTDKGMSWSDPVFVTPPGLLVDLPALVAGDGGRIAIAFPGTDDLPGGEYDSSIRNIDVAWGAYMVVADDATDGTPTFDVVLTSKADPIERGQSCASRCQFNVDFIDVIVTPSGQAFGAFVDGCTNAACIGGDSDDNITRSGGGQAIVGTVPGFDMCADVCHPFVDAAPAEPLTGALPLTAPEDAVVMPHPAEVLGEARFMALFQAHRDALAALGE